MEIFYLEQHTSCPEYLSEIHLGFKSIEVEKDTVFSTKDKKEKHLFFILEGSAKVRYNEFPERVFKAGEMFFLPKSADCWGIALTKCSFIVHIYDSPVQLCDKVTLNSIISCSSQIQYDFQSLSIRSTLNSYLLLLKEYLIGGINCRHLHEIKQKELFLILQTHYRKEELAQLFFPMLGKSLDFRGKVMAHYLEAKTAKELASLCCYSEGYFNEIFIAEFGETPYKWMQKQKSKHIIWHLAQTSTSLKEIANEFNFSSQSHFNKYCKSQYGGTAAQVRTKLLFGNQGINKKNNE